MGNKNDVEGHATVEGVIEGLELGKIRDREVSCYSISGLWFSVSTTVVEGVG